MNAGGHQANIVAMIAHHVAAHRDEVVLRKKDRGIWKATTWSELDQRIQAIRQGLQAAGFQPGAVAGVVSQTRPDFAYADLAILAAGGTSLAVHPDVEAPALTAILRDTQCRVLFVENEEQLDKVLAARGGCDTLRQIVIMDMKGLREFRDPQCTSLEDFLREGEMSAVGTEPPMLTDDQPALVLVPPNGGRARTLTHGDIKHLVDSAASLLGLQPGDERLAVLPMSDVTEHVLGLYLALKTRTVSNYLENPETAIENLQQVKPTVFGADAEAWSRLHARITAAANAATPLQRALYRWAITAGENGGAMASLARMTVLGAVKRELGLSRLRLAYVGGMPVAPDALTWARALGITIQRIDAPQGAAGEAATRYHALMKEAYAT